MIAIYEVRQKEDHGVAAKKDAEAIVKLIQADGDYRISNNVKGVVRAVMGEALETFVDRESKVVISICCDDRRYPARVQFVGIEPEVLDEKKKLEVKLNNRGYLLR